MIEALVLIAFYLAPCLVARLREHRQTNAICVINVFAGWTIIGWIICLAWAFMEERK